MRKTHLLSIFFLQDKLLQFVQNGGDAEFFQFFFPNYNLVTLQGL